MKVIVVKVKPRKRFLVELHTDKLVDEVATLVSKKKYFKAAAIALTKGRVEKEVADNVKNVKADLIIEENGNLFSEN